ncbi:hypothetical protein IQ07DRAFT_415772 [Pyrenochaeta sp. DS3sAY3a]|nr:hypothetical protein IQ07DRAFT_415772 [Pyrenochaeta sp. DS3sAY3a]
MDTVSSWTPALHWDGVCCISYLFSIFTIHGSSATPCWAVCAADIGSGNTVRRAEVLEEKVYSFDADYSGTAVMCCVVFPCALFMIVEICQVSLVVCSNKHFTNGQVSMSDTREVSFKLQRDELIHATIAPCRKRTCHAMPYPLRPFAKAR